ncbi:MAG: glycosyltransferase family 39 protein [Haloarculaceae archaeon]
MPEVPLRPLREAKRRLWGRLGPATRRLAGPARRVRRNVGGARRAVAADLADARQRVVDDLRTDPYLPYILVAAAVLAGFWVWHRLPNFATRDERWRVVDPIEAFAAVSESPSYEGLREGVTYWRSYGATFYVAALVLVPVLVAVVLTGDVDGFAAMGRHQFRDFWEHWLGTPAWVWSASVLAVRLVNVALTVGCVYLVYRLGATVRDRATGRLAALVLTVTWGLLVLAHEAGEDIPALFAFLLSFYLAVRYLETGDTRTFYWGCLAGGAGAALKLSAGVSALVLGAAFVLRAGHEPDRREHLWQPRFLAVGVGIGSAAIVLGYPSLLVGDPADVGGRFVRGVANKGEPHGWRVQPSWWWILRGYLHGLGLPLAVGALASALAVLPGLRERSPSSDALKLALFAVAAYLVVFSGWAYVRTHHLLVTFPLVAVVVAVAGERLREHHATVGRAAVALLLVTSGVYAVGGDLAYASQPRDQTAAWVAERAGPNTTVETYVRDPQEVGVPHGVTVYHPFDRRLEVANRTRKPGIEEWTLAIAERCPDYVVLNYHKSLLYLAPDDWSKRASQLSDADLERYFRDLLAGETYPYAVADRFGRRPRFLDGNGRRPTRHALVRVGVRPRTIQYGDPQDFGVDQYSVILERTGECDPLETSPLRSGSGPASG